MLKKHLSSAVGPLLFVPQRLRHNRLGPPSHLAFNPNDVVAIYGNGLADRMQHDPWVETVLQSQLKGMNVSFRNMSFSGDMVNKRPRNQGFTNDEEYLQHVAPDVVFSFYGYNESFAGPDGADAYRAELVKLVQRYTELRREQGKEVRFVLFSPIAYQNTGDRNLPDGDELNTNLAAYTEATRVAAAETGATFVDLFSPTLQLFNSSFRAVHDQRHPLEREADIKNCRRSSAKDLLGRNASVG